MASAKAWTGYAWAIAATLACTGAGLLMQRRFDPVNIAMVYLLAVVLISMRHSRGPTVLASVLSVVAFDILFVVPHGSFSVEDLQYVLTFAIMLSVGLIVARLTDDVRNQSRAQAALEVQAETERVRSALLASISHDVRTPLAVLAGASSSLAERGERMGADERRELAQSIFEQSREMSERVAKILEMTRLESGAIAIERDWDSLAEIAGSVLRRLGERVNTHRLMVEVPADLPLVRVDASLIEQVLVNLMENALRHTPAGTVVRLRAQHKEGEVVVSVEDYSSGLSDADLEGLFAKFSRSGENKAGGIGLGLAICRAIVTLHGGRIWAESIPGGGTAFRFALRVEEPPVVPLEAAA